MSESQVVSSKGRTKTPSKATIVQEPSKAPPPPEPKESLTQILGRATKAAETAESEKVKLQTCLETSEQTRRQGVKTAQAQVLEAIQDTESVKEENKTLKKTIESIENRLGDTERISVRCESLVQQNLALLSQYKDEVDKQRKEHLHELQVRDKALQKELLKGMDDAFTQRLQHLQNMMQREFKKLKDEFVDESLKQSDSNRYNIAQMTSQVDSIVERVTANTQPPKRNFFRRG